MVVVVLEKCPLSLRGDLTKWLQEISTGVYVGNVSTRVRENLWQRICSESKHGRATMVYSARNEQRLDFRVHNTSWEPIDFDGMKLMLRPGPERSKKTRKRQVGFSNAARTRVAKTRKRMPSISEYVVVDVETTGLDATQDEILEIAAILVCDDKEYERVEMLVRPEQGVPEAIVKLTGLTEDGVREGHSLADAMDELLSFVGSRPLVMHNSSFDMAFIDAALQKLDIDELENERIDTLALSRKAMPGLTSYRLEDIAVVLGIDGGGKHRAMSDCLVTLELFRELTTS